METNVYNASGEKTGMVQLPDSVFGLPWNAALVKQVVEAGRANKRANTAHTKDRGEVSGGGKKPWKQKGTGRAQHGSIRSPLWIGGGVTHGPRTERVYDQKINKRMRRKALLVSLSGKAKSGEIVVMEDLSFPSGRAREAHSLFCALVMKGGIADIGGNKATTLVALPTHDASTARALRNLPRVQSCEARNVTVESVLGVKYVMVPKSSLLVLESLAKLGQ
ncbi:MAG: 50S ribosomal protein L4 [Candidatus Ryanbacteria bacterium RIFCSPHIGHO2_02_FULL_45_17b]|nr:MAG: 50S ribosomal protein L4 [Candidatus Ryanbacteria bacterium RIFCSPHIGHO2_02_FULL_45_17b]